MENAWLDLAIQAIHNNELPRAHELLRGYVRYNRTDPQGWLWLSRTVEQNEEKTKYLRYALEMSPGDRTIRSELGAITGSAFRPVKPPVQTPRAVQPKRRGGAPHSRSFARAQSSFVAISNSNPMDMIRWAFSGLAIVLFLTVALSAVPLFLGNRTLIIESGSMEPAISTGSLVIAQPVPSSSLQFDDIVVIPSSGSQIPIVHRIVGMSERGGVRYYRTRGDANPSMDVTEITLPPTAWRVWNSVPAVGYLIAYSASPPGIVILIVIPLLSLFGMSVLDWSKKRRSLQVSV